MTVGHVKIGVDKYLNLQYNIHMTRTYMMYAGLTFLGYEYGETKEVVLSKTSKKFGEPNNWGVTNYKAERIRWPEEETV